MTSAELKALADNAHDAEQLLKALANRNRLMILCSLLDTELSVSALNQRLPLSQSALSQHLAALRQAGLVTTRRQGQSIFYRNGSGVALEVIQALKRFYCP